MSTTHREKQIAEAEEILGDRLARVGFVKALFFGHYAADKLPPYPRLDPAPEIATLRSRLAEFCRQHVDPTAIDRQADIPAEVIRGLGQLGVLGACLPRSCGGSELGQADYCRLLEVLGGHCASTALLVNAHHSIGPRAIVLFGTPEQQARWLPKLATGQWLSAFALTETEAGSDAGNVQTTATPTADGRGYLLRGEKRWITNGGIAQVLTVMARTPLPGSRESKITAFLVTPDMPGFEVVEARMSKLGVRGTTTARLAFHDMFVPRENVLGPLGAGLRIALNVLDFGRTTFGATCTGAARFCLARATEHAATRVQFGQPLGSFELVKEKLAQMAAGVAAMEATTQQTAALIDAGEHDYMLETAMLKVFATETLWRTINDTFQLFGGRAYFTDEPYERMLRDARINTIGEGANDVLRAFVAVVGMRDVGLELQGVLAALQNPLRNLGRLGQFAGRWVESRLSAPPLPVRHAELEADAAGVARLIGSLATHVERLLRTHREAVLERQYHLGRVANAAIDLYASCCVLRRADQLLDERPAGPERDLDLLASRYFLHAAARRVRAELAATLDNDDPLCTLLADGLLGRQG